MTGGCTQLEVVVTGRDILAGSARRLCGTVEWRWLVTAVAREASGAHAAISPPLLGIERAVAVAALAGSVDLRTVRAACPGVACTRLLGQQRNFPKVVEEARVLTQADRLVRLWAAATVARSEVVYPVRDAAG